MQTQVEVKLPKNVNEFRLIKKNYLIKSNKEIRQLVPFVSLQFNSYSNNLNKNHSNLFLS